MSSQRYERVSRRLDIRRTSTSPRRSSAASSLTDMAKTQVAAQDVDDDAVTQSPVATPNSPPPSFRSRNSSRRPSRDHERHQNEEQQELDDAFDAPSDDESDNEDNQDRRRLIQSTAPSPQPPADIDIDRADTRPGLDRNVTQIPAYASTANSGRIVGGGSQANDGVWANLNAKPHAGEDLDEKPPTYEQAAADATPPYWETTVLSPYASTGNPDDVFVDGLLVGSLFSFVWNALISMSFQLIGFLLTYLLHTTHAAKHGSRAGLGITLIQYGFQMRYAASQKGMDPGAPTTGMDGGPADPNAHDFNPSDVGDTGVSSNGLTTSDIISYLLMMAGWFVLIRSVADFMRARRQEALVRSTADRGLGTAVVAQGESPESSV